MEVKKLVIGIDIDEVLRHKWLQFDRYYAAEYGEDDIPEQPYCFDYFKHYKWEDTVEKENYLNEDIPDDINPLDYQIDKETGEAPVDAIAFRSGSTELTAKEVYNRFMYQDFLFEIYGSAPIMYKQMDLHVERFYRKYKDTVDFIIVSKENSLSIPSTMFFLSRMFSRFKNYKFVETTEEKWEGIDVLITTDPEILDAGTPDGKKVIKLARPYNVDCQDGEIKTVKEEIPQITKEETSETVKEETPEDNKEEIPEKVIKERELLQINDLIDNEDFHKIIKYELKNIEDNE